MNPFQYAQARLRRQQQLKNDVPNTASDVRVISTPLTIVRPAQEYLQEQRATNATERKGGDTQLIAK
jgi:hypothetical protein